MEIVTEPGDSSTATGIGNSVRSRILGHWKPKFSIGGLISVPDHLRKLDEQAFTPRLISIGPIHSSNAKLQNMKECKLQFCRCFIVRNNINYDYLEHTIREKEDEIRSYYAGTIVSSISSDDFTTMILVDGIFILEYFLRQYGIIHDTKIGDDPMATMAEWVPSILIVDLVLLENQLPFSILKMLYEQEKSVGVPLKELAFSFFHCYNFQNVAFEKFDANIEHFTDLVRFFYLPENLPVRGFGRAKLSYSATQLQEAGVKFKVCYTGHEEMVPNNIRRGEMVRNHEVSRKKRLHSREHREFLYIRFENGVLEIPCIKLDDHLVHIIRNVIALEQSLYVGHAYVTDFFVILDFLIDNSKDVDLLCDKGILVNYLGDSNTAASAVNNLNTNISRDYMNSNYSKICEDLNEFYKRRWHKWRATLRHQYFSTPWRVASTSAAIILLLLTAIQTICSLKSTKW